MSYSEYLRSATCYCCEHRRETKGKRPGYPEKCFCNYTKRWGKLERGHYCKNYNFISPGKEIADDGIIIKNRQPLDYRTETQWLEHGRIIKPGAKGKIMHATRHNLKTYVYFLEEQTEIMEVKND